MRHGPTGPTRLRDRVRGLGAALVQAVHRTPIAASSARTHTHPRAHACVRIDPPPCCALCGVARRRRPLRQPLCAAFPLGPSNTNACPPGSSKIVTAAACESAAAARLTSFGWGKENSSFSPSGCYMYYRSGYIYKFNDHPTGAANPTNQPLCAGAADSTPLHAAPMSVCCPCERVSCVRDMRVCASVCACDCDLGCVCAWVCVCLSERM